MARPKTDKDAFSGSGLTPEEIKLGAIRHSEYRKNYPQLNKLSNLQLLEELVWLECLQERFKQNVGIVTKPTIGPDGKEKIEQMPKQLQESIANGLEQIVGLKTKLGLFEDQQTTDAFKDFEALKKKAKDYRATHPLSYKCCCPWCTKIFFLKRRTDNYETFKSPFYADDKVIKNTPLYNLYKAGKITKTEAAEVMGVSADYFTWLEEKVYSTVKTKES